MVGTGTLTAVLEPKYWQLRGVLLRTIDFEFQAGQVLPNERDLAARFGVARATLRQALDQLEMEGRLVRRRGIGTVVAAPRVGIPVSQAQESWPGTARDTSWRTLDCLTATTSARLAKALGIDAGELVHTVRRLRMTGGQIVAAESLHVPSRTVPHLPGFVAEADRARSVLRQLQRLELDGESRAVELGIAEDEDARLLERPPGTPVLIVTTQYAAAGRIAALAVSTYRADTCRLTFGETGLMEVVPVRSSDGELARTAS